MTVTLTFIQNVSQYISEKFEAIIDFDHNMFSVKILHNVMPLENCDYWVVFLNDQPENYLNHHFFQIRFISTGVLYPRYLFYEHNQIIVSLADYMFESNFCSQCKYYKRL